MSATAITATESNLLPQTNDINCNNNPKVSATSSDQIDNVKTKCCVTNGTANSNSDSGNAIGSTNDKNNRTALKNSTNQMRQPPSVGDINNPSVNETLTTTATTTTTTATPSNGATAAAAALSRTLTRNSCSNMNGQSVAKSWYARCNRWRSQSCERRKHTASRYSWNMIGNRPA